MGGMWLLQKQGINHFGIRMAKKENLVKKLNLNTLKLMADGTVSTRLSLEKVKKEIKRRSKK